MHVILTVVGGKADRRQVRVKIPVMIGRSREAGLVVAHPMVSRRHCELYYADGVLRIRDLGSLNGVYVAGRRVVEAPLPPQSEFSIGPLTLRVDYSPEVLAHQAAQQAKEVAAAENRAKAAVSPPPPPPSAGQIPAEVGEFDLEMEFLREIAPADQPGFFRALAEVDSSGDEQASLKDSGDSFGEAASEAEPPNQLPTLFPEDLPPELRD
ncbi:MAG: FHA domain-containing protein [Thermoguttaceae bacterium]|nr:FHA domain-containing protein [Thermoguttaceae bacterium]MDW8079190.1 FHA domain-containing protein [Thermoguttaceae bacterium]